MHSAGLQSAEDSTGLPLVLVNKGTIASIQPQWAKLMDAPGLQGVSTAGTIRQGGGDQMAREGLRHLLRKPSD